jgi:ribosome assembly protein 3
MVESELEERSRYAFALRLLQVPDVIKGFQPPCRIIFLIRTETTAKCTPIAPDATGSGDRENSAVRLFLIMPPKAPAVRPKRVRVRKRKRRQASSSESSSDSSSSESDNAVAGPSKPVTPAKAVQIEDVAVESSSESSESSDSSSSSEDLGTSRAAPKKPAAASRSPSPIRGDLPPFFPPGLSEEEKQKQEADLRERFRKFWMGTMAEAFKDDLEQLRKASTPNEQGINYSSPSLQEPNLTTSRLALLIDSLGAGAETFTSSTRTGGVNEMELVLDQE